MNGVKWIYIALGGYIGFLPLMTTLFMKFQDSLNESIGAYRPPQLDQFYEDTLGFMYAFLPYQVIIGVLLVLAGIFIKRIVQQLFMINLAFIALVVVFSVTYHLTYSSIDLSIFEFDGMPSWAEGLMDAGMTYGMIMMYLFYIGPLVFAAYLIMKERKKESYLEA